MKYILYILILAFAATYLFHESGILGEKFPEVDAVVISTIESTETLITDIKQSAIEKYNEAVTSDEKPLVAAPKVVVDAPVLPEPLPEDMHTVPEKSEIVAE